MRHCVEQFLSYCQIACFSERSLRTLTDRLKKVNAFSVRTKTMIFRLGTIYQIQKTKNTQADCLHPSCRFCIRFQVAFSTREKIEGLDPQTVFSFLGSKSMDIKKYRQGSALSKNRENGPKVPDNRWIQSNYQKLKPSNRFADWIAESHYRHAVRHARPAHIVPGFLECPGCRSHMRADMD